VCFVRKPIDDLSNLDVKKTQADSVADLAVDKAP